MYLYIVISVFFLLFYSFFFLYYIIVSIHDSSITTMSRKKEKTNKSIILCCYCWERRKIYRFFIKVIWEVIFCIDYSGVLLYIFILITTTSWHMYTSVNFFKTIYSHFICYQFTSAVFHHSHCNCLATISDKFKQSSNSYLAFKYHLVSVQVTVKQVLLLLVIEQQN